jgi:hypothetical protein
MEMDVSKMSAREFGKFLYLNTELQNATDGGISYLDPAFRKQQGQQRLDIKKFSIWLKEGFDHLSAMKEIAEKTPENIAYVLRYPSGELASVYLLNGAKSQNSPEIKLF